MQSINLSIFGDNILECERMIELISSSFPELTNQQKNIDTVYAPTKTIYNKENTISIQLYPDYKTRNRWGETGILTLLEQNGAKLTEAPDIVLTKTINGKETILLAIEFSSSIPAGNQAWQRSGRALSFSEVNIPYLYIADIGLEELDGNRETKSTRSSNVLIPFSYIKHSIRTNTFTHIIFNPSYLLKENDDTKKYTIGNELTQIIRAVILEKDISKYESILKEKVLNYIKQHNGSADYINFDDWINKQDHDIEKYIQTFSLKKFNKIIANKSPIKGEMRSFIKDVIPDNALSIYKNKGRDLPICFIPSKNRKNLADKIKEKAYNSLNHKTYEWISNNQQPLVICIINGFKPKGEDSRPDRGLVPLARMLFGDNIDILTLVFGQAKESMQSDYSDKPIELASNNGLWKSILYYSSLTIADSNNWSLSQLKLSHFSLNKTPACYANLKNITFPTPNIIPNIFNENDIDTAIHLTFSKSSMVFESLCNPPGGDWSGISFLDKNNEEHRWMSLPRVTIEKRPDHIFQITDKNQDTYVLIVESKENVSGLIRDKKDLGKALKDYVTNLMQYTSNAIKSNGEWNKNDNKTFNLNVKEYITAASFFYSKPEEIEKAVKSLKVDFIIAFNIKDHNLHYKYITQKGKAFINLLITNKII